MTALEKKLLLLFALFLAVQAGGNLAKYAFEMHEGGGAFGGDFMSFWRAARLARAGDIAAIYNPDAWRAILAVGKSHELAWFAYPPFALLGLWPLGKMTYGAAVLVWSLAPLPAYFALSWLLAKRSGLGRDRTAAPAATASLLPAYAVLSALTLPVLSANLFSGQTGAIVAILFLGVACSWPNRPIILGICIGLLAIKPQMGLLLPFALAAAGQWRAIAAAAAMISVLIVASTLWLGVGIWSDYLRMTELFGQFIGHGYAGLRQLALGPYISLQGAGTPAVLAGLLQAVISLAVLAAIVRVFWRRGPEPADGDDGKRDLRLGLLAAGTLLATPYSLSYDTPMLVLAVIPLIARSWREGWAGPELVAVTALMVLPYATPLLVNAHVPVGPCALLLAFWALYRRYQREGAAPASMSESREPVAANAPILTS
jgi:hypothetical protein